MRAPLVLAVALVALAAANVHAAGSKPRIDDLVASLEPEGVSVSFRVADAVSDEILDRIRSGIPVTFKHKVEVLSRRSVPLWPSRVLARLRVETRVTYDSLNRTYDLVRIVTSKRPRQKPVPVEEARSTDSLEEAVVWLTELTGLPPLALPARPQEGRIRVRAESSLGRRYVWYVFYARQIISAELRLEG